MDREEQKRNAAKAREKSMSRIRGARRAVVGGTVAVTAGLAVLVQQTEPGKTVTRTATSTSRSSGSASSSGRTTSRFGGTGATSTRSFVPSAASSGASDAVSGAS